MKWKGAFFGIKRPDSFGAAVDWLNKLTENGRDVNWSIQYYGFGEHFTFWDGYGGFDDFSVDMGMAINWKRLKEIIIESAQNSYDHEKEHAPWLWEETDLPFLEKKDGDGKEYLERLPDDAGSRYA